ncbi:MAG: T9SS type A sorting domain-containing protein, partial [bacterium]
VLHWEDYTLPGSVTIGRNRAQHVPALAPAGDYTYRAYVGIYPWVIEAFDEFTFVKEGTDGSASSGGLGSPSDWGCTDEPAAIEISAATIPGAFAMLPVCPNPFNPTTTMNFTLPEASRVDLTIYDVSGRQVAQLVNGWRDAGTHEITFNASHLSAGVYVARLEAGAYQATQKLVLLK